MAAGTGSLREDKLRVEAWFVVVEELSWIT
jgi:hypothetical protein